VVEQEIVGEPFDARAQLLALEFANHTSVAVRQLDNDGPGKVRILGKHVTHVARRDHQDTGLFERSRGHQVDRVLERRCQYECADGSHDGKR